MKNNKNIKKLLFILVAVFFASCTKEESSNNLDNSPLYRSTIPILDNSPVQIYDQIWMKRNLNVNRYRNGDIIPQVQDQTQWSNLTTGAWCYYENNTSNGSIYGKLYNWYAVNDPRGLAPQGWHIPRDSEWTELLTRVGGSLNAGGSLRANVLWTGSLQSSDSYGFSALPAGDRDSSGYFDNRGSYMLFWTSSESDSNSSWMYGGNNAVNQIWRANSDKKYGLAIRCIKNN